MKVTDRNFPLAEATLILAGDQLQELDKSSRNALQTVVSGCEEKAKQLQYIFDKVERGVKDTDVSVLDLYRTSLLHLGKAHWVETLMQDILRGLDALAMNRVFRMASQNQIAQQEKALDQLLKVESSVPDSHFEGPETNGTQHNASGATGYQNFNTGPGQFINNSGKLYQAQTINFGAE